MKDPAYLPYLLGVGGLVIYGAVCSLAGPRSGGVVGAIRGEDGRLSSSKFQFFVWTGVVIFAWVGIFVAKAMPSYAQCEGLVPGIPQYVLLAMGFSVITLATAKGVTTAYVYAGRTAKGSGYPWSWSDLVRGDDSDRPDLSKVQMLAWTIIASCSYVYMTIVQIATHGFEGNTNAALCGLPNIDPALMALMGIGQGAYLGTKIVQSTTVILRNLSKPQTFAGDSLTINGSGFGKEPGSVLFGSVAALLSDGGQSAWTDSAIKVIVPSIDSTDNKPFEAGDSVMVAVLLTGADCTTSTGNTLPFTYASAPASTSTNPIAADQAGSIVRNWLDESMRTRTIAEGGPPPDEPALYRLDRTPTVDSPVMSVKGSVQTPPSARHVFFVDHLPRTNWEHWCSYVFVDDNANLFVVDSTVPPSARTEPRTRLPYTRPASATQ